MNVTISTPDLQQKISFVQHAISSRAQLPILHAMLLKAEGSLLTLSATDLEIGIETTVQCTVDVEGLVAVPAKLLNELVSSISSPTITLQLKGRTLEVVSKHTKTTLQVLSADEFPKLYEKKGEKILSFPTNTLKKDFQALTFSASTDTTRPALSGILLVAEEKKVLIVATDGYRLSLKKTSLTTEKEQKQLLIPARVFRELASMKHDEKEIGLYISPENNQVLFESGQSVIIGRLIDAAYPNFQKIIPTDTSTTVEFDREQLQKAVKMSSIFARDAANIVKLSVKKDMLVVSANTPSVGDNTVEVEAKLTGEENEIAFNARYLIELFANIEENDLLFEMTGPLNPGVFKIKGDTSFLHLIMPIRVQG